MLDCWLKDRLARPTFTQILKTLDGLLNPYDDPFCQVVAGANGQPLDAANGGAMGTPNANSTMASHYN